VLKAAKTFSAIAALPWSLMGGPDSIPPDGAEGACLQLEFFALHFLSYGSLSLTFLQFPPNAS